MKFLKRTLQLFTIFFLICIIAYYSIYIYAKYTTKLTIENASGFYIYDINGNLVDGLSDRWTNLSNISNYVIDATIAIEDKNFYKHKGFDFLRMIKAMYINVKNKKNLQGASTISQQLAKNLFLTFDKTWQRKIKEAWLTIKLETQYDKDSILESYLNSINYGGVYGIENAANYYFHKSAKELSLAEASMLVGIPKSPSNYSPLVNLDKAKKRQETVLMSMVKNNFITEDEMNKALDEELTYYGTIESNNLKTLLYYQDAIMNELKSINIPDTLKNVGGLKIYTYLDLDAQRIMEEAMNKNITDNEIEVSAVMMDSNSGHVLALIGGKDYSKSQFNRALNAKRQVGSTIKPILYYAALENGFTEATTFTSEETTFVFSGDKTYSPNNFNNKYGNKAITMAAALAYSDNIYAVKTHLFLGEQVLVDMAKRLGISSSLEAVPSMALGSGEVTLIEMVQAYATFSNLGYKVQSSFISRIEDMNGNILYENKDKKEPILNSSLTFILNEALANTYNYKFIDYNYPTCYDITSSLKHKYSIKTGTTDTDHLIFGYNPNIVLGIRSGYDDSRKSNSSNSKYVKYMWRDIMEEYLKDTEDTWYEIPNNVVGTLLNPITGEMDNSKNSTLFYFIKGTEPTYDKSSLEELVPTIKTDN